VEAGKPKLVKKIQGDETRIDSPAVKGIPGFWLTAFRNNQKIDNLIEGENDIAALKSLVDVKVSYLDGSPVSLVLFIPYVFFPMVSTAA
jgi:hypothetical protein